LARIVFMGTPRFAVASLEACFDLGQVVAVVTQPDKPKGRGHELAAPPVKVLAMERGVPVLQPPKVKGTNFAELLLALQADVAVVTAYGKLLPRDVLEAPRKGCVNVHASLLPRFRGAAPIQWALASGDERTGVCLMKMDEGMDTGPVLARAELAIGPTDTSETLHDRLAAMGAGLLRSHLLAYLEGRLEPVPQPADGVVMAPMIRKEDGRIDFGRPAAELERRLRAFTPWPGLHTGYAGALLKVLEVAVTPNQGEPGTVLEVGPAGIEVACGQGSLRLLKVQPEGKRPMEAREFLASRKIEKGQRPFDGLKLS
jgi:methionyl-tRNA formyltransferase